ncbi:subtilisin-like protease SBT5.3 isoform X2 [Cryptomeria japonica]|nr:subtilisin-like protease SBT5.3 isoform X2 [Cryptomeria japonica]
MGLERRNQDNPIIPKDSLWTKAKFGKDVIVANLDTGVWPESESFHDEGLGPIPSRWKGFCESGTNFSAANCNRKLIGARYFHIGHELENGQLFENGDLPTPRDMDGHGTHTLSTAAGNFAKNASLYGYAEGIAKGGAPHARVVAYKVCWAKGCYDSDILAAFDAGINEGVDVFSLSLGSDPPLSDYFQDSVAIGSYHAVRLGKVVVCSAGNAGPVAGSVTNVAPWIITVGASTIDRKIAAPVSLGNKKTYMGQSGSQFSLQEKKWYPLVSSVDVKASSANETAGRLCYLGALDPNKVKGKIVVCLRGITSRIEKGFVVRMAGGVGMILCNAPENGNDLNADPHFLPATLLNAIDGAAVFKYINKTKSPVAYIYPPKTVLNVKSNPVMADFSSIGPNTLTPDILKPDITAPGVNILAAWSGAASPSEDPADNRHVPFNIISGTSMSCPHVSGVAALLKAAYPHWSPAAIKSAIMTTASRVDNRKKAIKKSSNGTAGPFDYGAGHLNPNRAANPGLVYDASEQDYNSFLCSLGYNTTQLEIVTGRAFSCPQHREAIYNFNYPSISVSELKGPLFVRRTVTYVSKGPAVFEGIVRSFRGFDVALKPNKLTFSKMGEKKSFYVVLKPKEGLGESYAYGFWTWKSGHQKVTSPIVVKGAIK